MQICDICKSRECTKGAAKEFHKNCPMNDTAFFEETFEKYKDPETKEFYLKCSTVEAAGYCEWPRLREIIELCKRMNYKKIGIAFCTGLHEEAAITASVFRQHGLEVSSVMCKTGGIEKERIGVPQTDKILPDEFEPMCNPIAQAELLNREGTDLNVVLGLCVGHDSLFYRHSNAFVTTLVTKDRVLGHNPVNAIYCANTYLKRRLKPGE